MPYHLSRASLSSNTRTVPIISGGIVYDPERLAGEVEDYLRSLR